MEKKPYLIGVRDTFAFIVGLGLLAFFIWSALFPSYTLDDVRTALQCEPHVPDWVVGVTIVLANISALIGGVALSHLLPTKIFKIRVSVQEPIDA